MHKNFLAAGALGAALAMAACSDGGSAERAGEDLDSAIEETTQGEENLGDGPMERAGESIDEATDRNNDNAADAVSDATDNNPATTP